MFGERTGDAQHGDRNVADEYLDRVATIYRQHNPSKLGEVTGLLATKYKGREHELYVLVCNRYNVPVLKQYFGWERSYCEAFNVKLN